MTEEELKKLEEFEDIFGNTPFQNIQKIKEYIQNNFVSVDLYNKEKENNKELKKANKKLQTDIDRLEKKNKRYEKYLKNKDEEHEKVLEFIETEKEKLQADIEIKDKVIDLLIDDVYDNDNDNFWKLKCGFERIEKGKEKEYIKERFYKKVEEENE